MSARTSVLLKKAAGVACVDLRRTTSRHALQIRPTDRPRPSNHPPAPRAAYAHTDPELFAQGHALKSLRELAAGSAGQLAGAFRIPGESHRTENRGRFHRADDRGQPVRFLRRALCLQLSVFL